MAQRFHYGLNGLRGLASITVVVFHACLAFRLYGIDNAQDLPHDFDNLHMDLMNLAIAVFNGPACVTLFFVLSGLVLALSLERDEPLQGKTVLAYWVKRLFRLYPLLILATILSAALKALLFKREHFQSITTALNDAYQVPPTPMGFLQNLVGASASLNGPAWSITVEILASCIFPLMFLLSKRPIPVVVTLAALLLLMFTVHGRGSNLDHMRVYTVCFFVGALVPRFSKPLAQLFGGLPPSCRLGIITTAIIVFCCAQRLLSPTLVLSPLSVFLELLASTFIIAIVYDRPAGSLAQSFVAETVGKISYSIYLLHMPILLIIIHFWLSIQGNPFDIPWISGTILLSILTILVTLPVAYLSYTYFERPMEKLGRRIAEQSILKVAKASAIGPTGRPST